MKKSFNWEAFREVPVVGIMRGMAIDKVMTVMDVYHRAGMSNIEITMNTPDVLTIVNAISASYPTLNVGVGTVCSMADLDQVLTTAAQYIVTPIVDVEVIRQAKAAGLVVFAGAYSPTEIYQAWSAGADMVKVFPASQLGVKYVKDVLAPLDQIKLLPTGGVNIENLPEFLAVGAVGAGMGGSLFPKDLLDPIDVDSLLSHFEKVRAAAQS